MNIKITLPLLGFLCMCVQSCSDNSIDEPMFSIDASQSTTRIVENCQGLANEINTQILDGIRVSSRGDISDKIYPDFYGGSYIERDGTLRIFLAGDSLTGAMEIKKIVYDPIIQFSKCSYSYQELLDVLEDVSNALISLPDPVAEKIKGAGINEKDNTVEVFMSEISEHNISVFKNIYNHPAITFHKIGDIIYESTTNVSPGYKLCLSSVSDKNSGSFGFRARDKSNPSITGFVTAGHVIEADDYCFFNNITFGKCTKSYPNGAKADAAFIVPDNKNVSYELTNNINGDVSAILSTKTSQPGAGTYVNLWGAESGHQGGYIKSTTYIIYKNKVPLISDLVTADYNSSGGDSGGIIYTYVSSSKTRYTVGIHLGRATDTNLAIYSKADNVLSLLGVERY